MRGLEVGIGVGCVVCEKVFEFGQRWALFPQLIMNFVLDVFVFFVAFDIDVFSSLSTSFFVASDVVVFFLLSKSSYFVPFDIVVFFVAFVAFVALVDSPQSSVMSHMNQ